MWRWFREVHLKLEIEALTCAAQEQALRTNYVKFNIGKNGESPLRRMCRKKGEAHVTSKCSMSAQNEYKISHDILTRIIHWNICGKYKLMRAEKWYEHQLQGVIKFQAVKLSWDFNLQCVKVIEGRRPDTVMVEKRESICKIIDVQVPNDKKVNS